MMSYPNFNGVDKALQYVDFRLLAEEAERARVDLRIVYLSRSSRSMLVSNTQHNSYGGTCVVFDGLVGSVVFTSLCLLSLSLPCTTVVLLFLNVCISVRTRKNNEYVPVGRFLAGVHRNSGRVARWFRAKLALTWNSLTPLGQQIQHRHTYELCCVLCKFVCLGQKTLFSHAFGIYFNTAYDALKKTGS